MPNNNVCSKTYFTIKVVTYSQNFVLLKRPEYGLTGYWDRLEYVIYGDLRRVRGKLLTQIQQTPGRLMMPGKRQSTVIPEML